MLLCWSTWWCTGPLLLLLGACSPAGMVMPVRAAHALNPYRGPESSDDSRTLADCSSKQRCNYKCLLYCAPSCIFSSALCTWWILGSFCFSFSHREEKTTSLTGCWHSLARWHELLSLRVCPKPSLASLSVSSSKYDFQYCDPCSACLLQMLCSLGTQIFRHPSIKTLTIWILMSLRYGLIQQQGI